MEGGLSGQPTKCRYCRYPATKGCCHGNHFLAFFIWGAHWNHLANTAAMRPYVRSLPPLVNTRHRASTSVYSLTFCVRVMSPERHHWKPAVQAAAVMLRTPTVTRQSLASSARRPRPDGRSHYVVISRDGRRLVTRVCIMLP